MANRYFREPAVGYNNGVVEVCGLIAVDSSAAVTGVTGRGFTAAKTATGSYTITLSDAFYGDLGVLVSLYIGAGATKALFPRVRSVDAAAKTIIVDTVNGSGAPTDNTTAAITIAFNAKLRNSSVL